jgi:hypothetical protein
MLRRILLLGLLPALLIVGIACGGDSEDGGDDPTATSEATEEAMDDASATATDEAMDDATATATEEMMDHGLLAAVDGVTCTGDWTNLTFGSTGSFEAVFAANEAGDAGTVTITLGGNALRSSGGTVELPLMTDGDNITVDADADFLGTAQLTFDSSGSATDAVFAAPPGLGAAGTATLADFAFDGESLTTRVLIDLGDGSAAESAIESTCS